MRQQNSTYFYCFSPLVMLVTFLIEIIGAIYIIWRYKMTAVTRLTVSILTCLGIFQGAEYMLCGGFGMTGGAWSQVGYSAITLLPPLGLHLAQAIAGKKANIITYAAYGSAALFVSYFAFMTGAISGHTCYANYAVFDVHRGLISATVYGAYYYGWLFAGVWACVRFSSTAKEANLKRALLALAVGYSAFIIPTTVVNLIDPSTIAGIPSIMCGFAVLLAFILIGKVAPESILLKTTKRPFQLRLPF
jgi:hypothetical protein